MQGTISRCRQPIHSQTHRH